MIVPGDCIERMRELDDASIDAVVTDPPYGLEFMGKEWDSFAAPARFQSWSEAWAVEALRVLRPGGHLVSFGGTRTYHRMTCGIEDAGFEIRDQLAWLFGSGFPKSLDVAKALDKAHGVEGSWRQEDHPGRAGIRRRPDSTSILGQTDYGETGNERHVYEAASDVGRAWKGWGTALKPAHEPIALARKPLVGTVAANVAEHGTGALNIDACRIEHASAEDLAASLAKNPGRDDLVTSGVYGTGRPQQSVNEEGRWPANVVLDEEAGALLDDLSGERAPGNHPALRNGRGAEKVYGSGWSSGTEGERRPTETGGASRFFYCAKVSRAERNAGLEGDERNDHPTVKPISLMRWLIRLVTPAGGFVLDPFLGSGSTGCAAALEGRRLIGVERDAGYLRIAEARIAFWTEHGEDGLRIVAERDMADRERKAIADAGQLGLFEAAS